MKKTKPPRLTWRNEPSELGLRAIGQGPRGRIGKVGGVDLVYVAADGGNWARRLEGWYWYAFNGVNAGKKLWPTKDAAQADATAYYLANYSEILEKEKQG